MKAWQVNAVLVTIVMVWGSTFFVVRDATSLWPPVAFVGLRFGIAALALLPWMLRSARSWTRADVRAGFFLGVLLYIGYVGQTVGLSLISASRGGFITGLNVVFVPLLSALLWRTQIKPRVWAGVALSVAGMYVLARDKQGGGAESLLGDGLVLLCAVMFAAHIIAVGRFANGRSLIAINGIQMVVVAALAALTSPIVHTLAPTLEPAVTALPPAVLWAALYLGVVATTITLATQIFIQRYASPTHTALVFVLEPLFAALFAWMFGNEQLSVFLLWGGALMFMGILLAELPPLATLRRPGRAPHKESA